MPKLIRLYIQSVALGFALAAIFTGVLIWQDVAGVGHLIMASDMGLIAAAMLVVFNGIVFSAVQFALAVTTKVEDDYTPRGGLRDHSGMIPIRVEVRARRKID
jgi:TRAP-type C4-dicarboxylate transport system permease small subunit